MKIFRPQPRLSGQGNHKVPEASVTLLFVVLACFSASRFLSRKAAF